MTSDSDPIPAPEWGPPGDEGDPIRKYMLALALRATVTSNEDYQARYRMVLRAMWLAAELGYETGYRIDSKEPEWPVAFIHLPGFGAVSYHMPQFPHEWDGHTTQEKFYRIEAWAQQNAGVNPIKDAGEKESITDS